MNEGQPTRPANIVNIVAINQGKLPLTMDAPTAPGLEPGTVSAMMSSGHCIVDTRSPAAFAGDHIPGAFNIQLGSPEFEQRVGWLIPLDAPLILVLESDDHIDRALHKLAFIGLDQRVEGYLAGGMGAWMESGHPQTSIAQVTVQELQRQLESGEEIQVLDVREPEEWHAGHIDGASSRSYKQLEDELESLELRRDRPLAVICAQGGRSSSACSILLRNGFEQVRNVTGGMTAWIHAGLPTTRD